MGNLKDLTGLKFGRLTVEKRDINNTSAHAMWICLCECGNKTIVRGSSLVTNKTLSCGCLVKDFNKKAYTQNLTGVRFGNLKVLEKIENSDKKGAVWACLCDCGKITIVQAGNLKNGSTKSCGCNKRNNSKTHGMTNTRLYHIWSGAKQRCNNKKSRDYKHYGERGITFYQKWANDFLSFYNWAINNGYSDNLTIDRKNNDLGYSPENCHWITNKEQQSNKRNNKSNKRK